MRFAVVALGGLVGSVARFWLAGVAQRVNGSDFPFGTLAVNVLGSFTIGVVMALALERGVVGPTTRLFLTVGFCGGFTTMSTFGYETFALANMAASLGGSLIAVWLGYMVGRVA